VPKAVILPAAAIEEPLALAFVNTLFVEDGAEIDGLSSFNDVERWYRRVAPTYARASLLDSRAAPGLGRLRTLRSTLRLALEHHVRAQATDADVRSLQNVLGAGLLAPVFGVADGRVVVEAAPQTGTFVDRIIRDIADSFVNLLNDRAPERIKRCGGEDCVLFFVDRSKAASRAWCSMRTCGNRHKAALHYRRHQRTDKTKGNER